MPNARITLLLPVLLAACVDDADSSRQAGVAAKVAANKKKASLATASKAERAQAARHLSAEIPDEMLLTASELRAAAADGKCKKVVTNGATRTISGPCRLEQGQVQGTLILANIKLDDDDPFTADETKEQRITFEKLQAKGNGETHEIDGSLVKRVTRGKEYDLDLSITGAHGKRGAKPAPSSLSLYVSCAPEIRPNSKETSTRCTTRKDKISEGTFKDFGWFEVRGNVSLLESLVKALAMPGTLEFIGADTMVLDLASLAKLDGAGADDPDECFAATVDGKKIDPVCLTEASP